MPFSVVCKSNPPKQQVSINADESPFGLIGHLDKANCFARLNINDVTAISL